MKFKDMIPWKKTPKAVRETREDHPFFDMQRGMNKLFEDFSNQFFGGLDRDFNWETGLRNINMDISESDNKFTLSAELPGIDPKDVEVNMDGDCLNIRAEKFNEEESKDKAWHRTERTYGSFYRRLQLPPEADTDHVQADFKNGVLKINIPKTSESIERSKRIPVNS